MKHFLIALLVVPIFSFGQDFPKDYFASPLKIPLLLAGNFGEIRPGHFHAGIDIKTQGEEGHAVVASADGYVSRIKVSSYGYGKVLYITHPNGYTTVYGHLQKFHGPIEEYVTKMQYKRESYVVELFPDKGSLAVKQGDTIALSGNTGSSGGPHLHFEIRQKGQIPTNPLMYGFNIKDDIKPTYKHLAITPNSQQSFVNGKNKTAVYKLSGGNGTYKIVGNPNIEVHGNIGFEFEAIDNLNGSANRCGVYNMALWVGESKIYEHEINRIGFYETRFINSHVNFYEWKKNTHRLQRNYLQPNNQLSIYKNTLGGGLYNFVTDSTYKIKHIAKDAYGNQSSVSFEVKSLATIPDGAEVEEKECTRYFRYDEYNSYQNDSLVVSIPEKLLYEDLCFQYKASSRIWGAISATHHIHNTYTPLHSHMTISIKADSLPAHLQPKALVVALSDDKKIIAAEGGTYADGFVTVKTRSLGPYAVVLDTIPPKITPINIANGRNMAGRETIQVKIADNLSGIKTYRGTIDGEWIRMAYDHKKNLLTYLFSDKPISTGEHTFKLVVGDVQKNESSVELKFSK